MSALEFEAQELGRWDSALMVRILAIQRPVRQRKGRVPRQDPAGRPREADRARRGRAGKDGRCPQGREDVFPPAGRRVGPRGLDRRRRDAQLHGRERGGLAEDAARPGAVPLVGHPLVIQQCGPEALGIVALINFLIGLILAFVGATELTQFGASIYTADLVAMATVREMACIMTGIIICGRTGAAFAAQLGTMKVNQEIEAFQTFGISPFEFLVLPRMLALILMMPLLCLFADLISIAGGFLVSTLMLDVTPALYLHRTVEAISLVGFLLGVFKGAFFGVLVALTGCLRGMQCGTNAAAVGQATTSAVVTGITWIIASDGIFAVICSALHI